MSDNDKNAYAIAPEPDPFAAFRITPAYRVGNLVLLSGQAAISEAGEIIGAGDFEAQAKQTMKNIVRVLDAAGSDLSKIIKVTIYLTDMANFPKILELRETWFTPPYPADTIVEVTSLALPELMIEIDATAIVEGEIIG